MSLIVASGSYDFRQPVDAICLVVFAALWALAKPEISGHRVVAFLIVAGDGVLMFRQPIVGVGLLLVPLALIWFSEMLGGMRGMIGNGGLITVETPSWMVAGFGWIVLLIGNGFLLHECFGSGPTDGVPSTYATRAATSGFLPSVAKVTPPEPLHRTVMLTTDIEMPVFIRGVPSGSVLLRRGTHVSIVSAGRDSLVIRYVDSTATIPVTSTDLPRASP